SGYDAVCDGLSLRGQHVPGLIRYYIPLELFKLEITVKFQAQISTELVDLFFFYPPHRPQSGHYIFVVPVPFCQIFSIPIYLSSMDQFLIFLIVGHVPSPPESIIRVGGWSDSDVRGVFPVIGIVQGMMSGFGVVGNFVMIKTILLKE